MIWLIVVIVLLVLVALFAVMLYNGLVQSRNRVDNAWGQVDVQLNRRYDLIPNLVETVKGYATHEKETLEKVIAARNSAVAANDPGAQAQADNMLTGMLRQLFAVAEAYPDLKANQNFQQLQTQLSETENKIAIARQIYNDTVLTYNNKVQTIPSSIMAGVAGFKTRSFFDAPGGAEEAPSVQF
jgi:LemA protein